METDITLQKSPDRRWLWAFALCLWGVALSFWVSVGLLLVLLGAGGLAWLAAQGAAPTWPLVLARLAPALPRRHWLVQGGQTNAPVDDGTLYRLLNGATSEGGLHAHRLDAETHLLWQADGGLDASASPVPVIDIAADGQVQGCNAAARHLMAGQTALLPLLSPDDKREFLRRLAEAAAGRLPDALHLRLGERAVQIKFAHGPSGVRLWLIDDGERQRLEAQFIQAQKLQAVGQLAGGVAHDFNNLLTAILGHADLLLAHRGADHPDFEDLTQIRANANRAAALVRQLLAFSRQQTLTPQQLDLPEVLAELSHLLKRLVGEKITIRQDHQMGLWAVRADKGQFEQVIANLVVNARDAMPDGGIITLSGRNRQFGPQAEPLVHPSMRAGDWVVLSVADQGSGIPDAVMPHLFEPFFTTKEVGKGTGLGLATVYGIIKQSGGFIFAENNPAGGAVFHIYLPRHQAEIEATASTAAPSVPTEQPRQTGRILLVEDEDGVRAFAERALRSRGHQVDAFADGEEALEQLPDSAPYDLLLSDVVMPTIDGPTLARRVRAQMPGIAIILMSGYAEEQFRKSLRPDEDFAFLGKPYTLKALTEAVDAALRARR